MKLEVKNLSVNLDGLPILRHVSLEVRDGEFVSLLGPSGCGKTTMLKTIAGLLPVSEGAIYIGSQEVSRLPTHKRGAVVVFQDLRMFPHMTAAENVAFPLKMRGVAKKERLSRAEEYLRKVRLEGRGDQPVSKMSGGQQQRIALARALAAEPKLLLLDEPFSALDENLREDMRSLVKELQREFGITTVLVTHDRGEALSMSDRIALMFDGRIVQYDTPQEVYARPATRQAADYFGGCVYLPGHVSSGRFQGSGVACPTDAADGDYVLLLRPDDLDTDHPGDYRLTVEALSFRGSDTLATLGAEDGTVWKKSFPGSLNWKPGDTIRAALRLEGPVLYPQSK